MANEGKQDMSGMSDTTKVNGLSKTSGEGLNSGQVNEGKEDQTPCGTGTNSQEQPTNMEDTSFPSTGLTLKDLKN